MSYSLDPVPTYLQKNHLDVIDPVITATVDI